MKKLLVVLLMSGFWVVVPSTHSHKTVSHFHWSPMIKRVHRSATPVDCRSARNDQTSNQAIVVDGLEKRYHYPSRLGAGQRVALFELEQVDLGDIKKFDGCYFRNNGAAHRIDQVHVRNVDGGATSPPDIEAEIDIEIIAALAPNAQIDVYTAPNSPSGIIDEWKAIAASGDKVVSNSWGGCEFLTEQWSPTLMPQENVLFKQMASRGVNIFTASGDTGSEGCFPNGGAGPNVDDPASQPYDIAVGGTSFTNRDKEVTWNDGLLGGASGGGESMIWTAPSWQKKVDVGANREVPDVSAFADPYPGLVTYYDGPFGPGWNTIGGTSIAAPEWAAGIADLNDVCSLGFIAPKLYANSWAMKDITSGNNDMLLANNGLFPAHKGYDMATGLGTPYFNKLQKALCP